MYKISKFLSQTGKRKNKVNPFMLQNKLDYFWNVFRIFKANKPMFSLLRIFVEERMLILFMSKYYCSIFTI